jgi:hypothetical protein
VSIRFSMRSPPANLSHVDSDPELYLKLLRSGEAKSLMSLHLDTPNLTQTKLQVGMLCAGRGWRRERRRLERRVGTVQESR